MLYIPKYESKIDDIDAIGNIKISQTEQLLLLYLKECINNKKDAFTNEKFMFILNNIEKLYSTQIRHYYNQDSDSSYDFTIEVLKLFFTNKCLPTIEHFNALFNDQKHTQRSFYYPI